MRMCPNGCDEVAVLYTCQAGFYLGCPECLWAGRMRETRAEIERVLDGSMLSNYAAALYFR